MQKIIKTILAMNDSTKLNEKEMTENALSQTQGVAANEDGVKPEENTSIDDKKTATGKVTSIGDGDVLIDFGNKEEGVVPVDKFTKGIAVGDKQNCV